MLYVMGRDMIMGGETACVSHQFTSSFRNVENKYGRGREKRGQWSVWRSYRCFRILLSGTEKGWYLGFGMVMKSVGLTFGKWQWDGVGE